MPLNKEEAAAGMAGYDGLPVSGSGHWSQVFDRVYTSELSDDAMLQYDLQP